MKNTALLLILGIFIYSCATTTNRNMNVSATATSSDTIRIANDSLEYEILIIEPGFNSWVVSQKPRGFYSETFLESKNRVYVPQYNQRVLLSMQYDSNLYIQQINYELQINYGYEVNYLLYNYFLYLEQRYKQRFIGTRGGRF